MINYWHLIAAVSLMVFGLRRGLSSIYPWLIFSLSIYTVSLAEVSIGGFYLKLPELLFGFFAPIILLASIKRFDARALLFVFVFLLPFFIALMKNLISFQPIQVWEINAENRINWWDKLAYKDSLTSTNFTQFLYIVFALMVFLVGAHIRAWVSKERFVEILKWTLLFVSLIGVLQVVLFYSGLYDLYIEAFYNFAAAEFNRLAYHELAGIKRINSTFTEPSVYGFYITLSVFVMYILQGAEVFSSRRVLFALCVGLFSLSGSFYVGAALLGMVVFVEARLNVKIKIIFLTILASFILLGVILSVDLAVVAEFFEQKRASLDERLYYGIFLPVENIAKSPWFGFAFGTDRPTTLMFNLLISVGLFGAGLLILSWVVVFTVPVVAYLAFWGVMGFLIPDLSLYFIWFYLGAIYAFTKNRGLTLRALQQ